MKEKVESIRALLQTDIKEVNTVQDLVELKDIYNCNTAQMIWFVNDLYDGVMEYLQTEEAKEILTYEEAVVDEVVEETEVAAEEVVETEAAETEEVEATEENQGESK